MPTKQTLDDLRNEIERKYQEALIAFKVIIAYVSEGSTTDTDNPPARPELSPERQLEAPCPLPIGDTVSSTKVDRVLGSIGAEFKSVEQIATEVQLRQQDVRAVLYSKHARDRVTKKKHGKLTVFRIKDGGSHVSKNGDGHSMAAMARDVLAKNPSGVTSTEIIEKISAQIGKEATNAPAVSSALHHMKMRGAVEHNADGTYRLLTI